MKWGSSILLGLKLHFFKRRSSKEPSTTGKMLIFHTVSTEKTLSLWRPTDFKFRQGRRMNEDCASSAAAILKQYYKLQQQSEVTSTVSHFKLSEIIFSHSLFTSEIRAFLLLEEKQKVVLYYSFFSSACSSHVGWHGTATAESSCQTLKNVL